MNLCAVSFFLSFFFFRFSAISFVYKKTFNGTERKTTQKMKRYVMADRSTPTEHSLFSSHMCCRALRAIPLTQLSLALSYQNRRILHTHKVSRIDLRTKTVCVFFFFYELITCMRLYERMSMNVWMRVCVCGGEWMQATLLPSVRVSLSHGGEIVSKIGETL